MQSPDPKTLTEFSRKAKAEIEAHRFAAATGGLVNLTTPTFWELFNAAQAWHEHAAAMKQTNDATAAYMVQGADLRELVDSMVRAGAVVDERPTEPQPATAA